MQVQRQRRAIHRRAGGGQVRADLIGVMIQDRGVPPVAAHRAMMNRAGPLAQVSSVTGRYICRAPLATTSDAEPAPHQRVHRELRTKNLQSPRQVFDLLDASFLLLRFGRRSKHHYTPRALTGRAVSPHVRAFGYAKAPRVDAKIVTSCGWPTPPAYGRRDAGQDEAFPRRIVVGMRTSGIESVQPTGSQWPAGQNCST